MILFSGKVVISNKLSSAAVTAPTGSPGARRTPCLSSLVYNLFLWLNGQETKNTTAAFYGLL
jgi:hypothetical protein